MKNRVNKVIDQFKDEDKLLFSDEVEKDALCAYESGDLDKLLRGEDVPYLTNKYHRKESLYRNEKNKLFQKIYMYFEEKRNWREKMDTPCDPIPMTIEEYAAMKERDKRKCNADSGEQTISE